MTRTPRTIFIERDDEVTASPVTERFIRAFPNAVRHTVRSLQDIDAIEPPTAARAKTSLFLMKNRGAFVRRCPGTRYFVCCDYRVIDAASQCPFDCSYCFLHAYDNARVTSVAINLPDMVRETANSVGADEFVRIGTGELSDSLVYDDISRVSDALIPLLNERPRMFFELKTKSDNVGHVIAEHRRAPYAKRIVIAFSLNPEHIIRTYEKGCAPLSARLAAAARCARAGFSLAFHFDPVIRHASWQRDYMSVIDKLYRVVPKEAIAWISMGCLRFPKALKDDRIAASSTHGALVSGDFLPSDDGKFRYFRTHRETMYRTLHSRIRSYDTKTFVYLCMETPAMWRTVFGKYFSPDSFASALERFIARYAA
ncbi:MAG: spore photoproduct lyase family protein [Spirochaetota bacterium]